MRLIFNQEGGSAYPDLRVDAVFLQYLAAGDTEIHTSQMLFVDRARVALLRGEISELTIVDPYTKEEYTCRSDGMMPLAFWRTFDDVRFQLLEEILDWAGAEQASDTLGE